MGNEQNITRSAALEKTLNDAREQAEMAPATSILQPHVGIDIRGATGSRAGPSRGEEGRGYAGLGQTIKGKTGETTTSKTPGSVVAPKSSPEPEKQGFGSAILSAITTLARNFVSRTELQGIINTNVPSELRMVGNLASTGTKYLQLPSGYVTAVWGPGGGVDYDHVYVGGIEYTPGANPNGYDFLRVGADGSSSWIPAMISPMPPGYEIYDVTKNHIHITGATAGNI